MKSSVFKRLLLLLLLVLSFKSNVFATHFRYGNISWTYVSGRTVTFHISEAWRRSYFGTPVVGNVISSPEGGLNLGDGNIVPVNLTVTSINIADDWFYGEATVTYTYATNGSFLAFFTSCCRISTLQNNADGNFQVSSRVNIGTGNSSPVSSSPPIVNVSTGLNPANIQLAASDPDGNTLSYRLATVAETGGSGSLVSGLTINPATGLISFNTVGKAVGNLYSATFVVSDGAADIMVDVIFKIIAPSNPPVFDYSVTPANATSYEIQPGIPLTFNVKALDNDPGDVVTLSAIGLPPGVILSPVLPVAGNPVATAFSWTPTLAQLGARVVNFIATDGTGAQTTTTVTIIVSMDPVFDVPPTPAAGSMNCILSGVPYSTIIQAHAPDPAVNLRITSATIPGGATLTPALPSPLANASSTTLNWTPAVSNFGVNPVSFTATDALGHTQTQSFDLVVNTPPVYTSSPPATTVLQGQPFSYDITAADPDLPFGDILDINGVIIPSWLTFLQTGPTTATLSGTPGPGDVGLNPVQLELEDIYHHCFAGGVVQSFTIDVLPCTFPGITCPANISVGNDAGQCGANVSFAATATGTPSPDITYSIAPGSFFPIGTTTVTATASNPCGSLDCSFTVTVSDTENPTATCPGNITVNNDPGLCAAAVTFTVGSSDNCSGSILTQTGGLSSGALFPVGSTTNSFLVTDASGNTAVCSFDVIIRDAEQPTLTCPGSINVIPGLIALNNDPGICGAVFNYTIPYSDNCAGSGLQQSAGLPGGSAFPVGTTINTFVVTDASGNTSSCSFSVRVTDNEKPIVNCPAAQAFCSVVAGVYNIPVITASDNCSIQSVSFQVTGATPLRNGTGDDASGAYSLGNSTITWTVTDIYGNMNSCTTQVTINPLPVASITVNPYAFCNALSLTANSTLSGPFGYEWYDPSNQLFAVAQTVNLGLANSDGTYSVFVTDGNGCRSLVPATYTYQQQIQLSNYTVIALKELKFEGHQNVLNGSVGVTAVDGKALFDDYDSIPYPVSGSPTAFVKCANMTFGSPVYIPNRFAAPAVVTLPPVLANTSVPTGTNFTVNTNNWIQPAGVHYKDITIKDGLTATLTDNVYGKVTVHAGAKVIFSKPDVNISELNVADGKNTGLTPYTQVSFINASNVIRISKEVNLGSYNKINPEGNAVTFYLSDGDNKAENFNIEDGWNTIVNANIYIPVGQLFVEKKDKSPRCYMNGVFIAQKIHADHYITWSNNNCSNVPHPFFRLANDNSFVSDDNGADKTIAPVVPVFKVKVYPNPASDYFNMDIQTSSVEKIQVRVFDLTGQIVEEQNDLLSPGIIFGRSLASAVYFVEISQGSNTKMIRILKTK